MLTEKEMGEKFCMFYAIMAMIGLNAAANGAEITFVEDKQGRCLGSKCAHWRWGDLAAFTVDGVVQKPGGGDAEGYCGLAGKP